MSHKDEFYRVTIEGMAFSATANNSESLIGKEFTRTELLAYSLSDAVEMISCHVPRPCLCLAKLITYSEELFGQYTNEKINKAEDDFINAARNLISAWDEHDEKSDT